jgi:hypothetical protein
MSFDPKQDAAQSFCFEMQRNGNAGLTVPSHSGPKKSTRELEANYRYKNYVSLLPRGGMHDGG